MKLNSMSIMTAMGLAMAVAACSNSSSSDAGSTVAAIIHDDCVKAFSCQSTEPTGDASIYGSTEAQCETNLTALIGDVDASVTAGRVTFNASGASGCESDASTAINAESCTDFWASTAVATSSGSCTTVFVGTVATGGTCTSALDCVTGDNCTVASGSTTLYPGTCQPSAS